MMSEKWTIYGLCTMGDSGMFVPLDHPMVTTIVLHSPGGGWQLNEDRLGYVSRENANKDWVKQLKQARLLASAPDLLEALQGLLEQRLGTAQRQTAALKKAKEAIDRATNPEVDIERPCGRASVLDPAEWEHAFEGRQQPFPPSMENGLPAPVREFVEEMDDDQV